MWTCITCLPYRLLYLTYITFPDAKRSDSNLHKFLFAVNPVFFNIVVIGIVINPWITILTQRMYRECLLLYVKKCASILSICGIEAFDYQNPASRRQSRPSIATQRSSAALSECKRLNEAVDV